MPKAAINKDGKVPKILGEEGVQKFDLINCSMTPSASTVSPLTVGFHVFFLDYIFLYTLHLGPKSFTVSAIVPRPAELRGEVPALLTGL